MTQSSPPPPEDGYAYPLMKSNQRSLPKDYRGWLVYSDIDNTYLITKYESWRDLIRLRFESAHSKVTVAGAPQLMRALRVGTDPAGVGTDPAGVGTDPAGVGTDPASERCPIYFVSASPEAMRSVLEKRLLLDEVEFDGASFRNLWSSTTPHLRHFKDIYGYKITALLCYRLDQPLECQEILFGDDLEHDPEIYVLYARICSGQLRGPALDGILDARGLLPRDRKYILALADKLPEFDPVKAIYIRKLPKRKSVLEHDQTPPFDASDERLRPFQDYLQAALWLHADGAINKDGLLSVARALVSWQAAFPFELRCQEIIADMPKELRDEARAQLSDIAQACQQQLKDLAASSDKAAVDKDGSKLKLSSLSRFVSQFRGQKPPKETPDMSTEDSKATDAPAPDASPAEAEAPASDFKDEIKYDDFVKLDLRIALVKTCEIVEGADRLLKLELDVGSETRTVVSGIRQYYSPEDLVGKQVVYLANLKGRKLRGIMSQGMVLAASSGDDVVLLKAAVDCEPGSKVS